MLCCIDAVHMADTGESLAMKTVTKLLLSAEHYASISPAVARLHLLEAERVKKKLRLPASTATQVCPRCFTIRRPDNCSWRLIPRMKNGRQVQRLQRRNAGGRRVGKFAKSLLDLHSEGANRIRVRCHFCRKQTFLKGAVRPAKVSQTSLQSVSKNQQVQVSKKKKKRRKKQTADFSTTTTDALFPGKEKLSEKCQSQMPSFSDCHTKRKATNKKETLKQKHSALQNILKRKTNAASPDTSAALRSFLTSL